ncbi:tail fiber-like repeat protein [Buttiauxella sp. JUb87]|uniref:phage tail protein n=1 Tax=Buttiauxella sp. JUb87 TaxID=2485129 RepID=UPI0010D1BCB5|nr:phage tail protein [Buttiauxella sp. JUb87]TDN51018.1 tail fiber-like repeat protein [Buttiauxella sp. JUb87]
MAKFKTIITTAGAAKIAAVLAGTGSIVLDNTAKMAVGDGSGTLPTPNPAQTKLVNEVHRASINKASIDASDPKNIIAELVIPPETGGFWLREMALYDAAGTLLAVGNMAETYKPSLSEGAGRKMVIRMVIAVSEVSAVTITMDTSTVMATQDYVDTEIDKHAKSRNHPDATLTAKGFTQLNSATDSASETQAATPKAVKTVMDATSLKAPLASPALSGVPTAPTAPPGTNNQQLANTQFVLAAIASLINSAPGVLDTLGELAAALGNDANFAATMTAALAAKAPLASPALSGLPTAPTAAPGTSTLQLANTAFVMTAVASLVNSSPAALDTLKELADALGNDANFAATMTNALAGKQPKDTTLTNISGKDVAGLLQYLGLKTAAQRDVGTAANQIPDMSSFAGAWTGGGGGPLITGAGWRKGPDGVIEQWGVFGFSPNATGTDVVFPTPFPSRVESIVLTFADIQEAQISTTTMPAIGVNSVGTLRTGFTARMSGVGGFNLFYRAIGR